MISFRRWIIISTFSLCLIGLLGLTLQLTSYKSVSHARLIEDTQLLLNQYKFHGSVLVVKDQQVIYEESFGNANRKQQIPNTPNTRYYIASLTKSMLSTAIYQLQEQHKLHVSDSVSRYIPAFKDQPSLTILHLLSHTSGLDQHNETTGPVSADDLITEIHSMKPVDYPGHTFRYSDSNYSLLAAIIDLVSGMPYEMYVRTHIFEPANMKTAGFTKDLPSFPDGSTGYTNPKSLQTPLYIDMSELRGSGDVYATIKDIYQFDRALSNGTLLSSSSLSQMLTKQSSLYASGWFLGKDTFYHTGSIPGWTSGNFVSLDHSTLVILLSNQNLRVDDITHIGFTIMKETQRYKK
ncbi:serine hydrolase domain-containing protein [Ectobacillus panaciterrae]|uniref:serine hydrolase domain-containing protein n=1 Tax=Ectobacillus panaciterrae TaxID=363872 RepID=UPI00138AAFD8|nr:serine hydrolase domain-containing protein [Ectobacillus panaciterrae]